MKMKSEICKIIRARARKCDSVLCLYDFKNRLSVELSDGMKIQMRITTHFLLFCHLLNFLTLVVTREDVAVALVYKSSFL